MKHLKKNLLLYSLAACIVAILALIYIISSEEKDSYYYPLLVFLVITLVFLTYLYWLTKHSTSVLLLGGPHSDNEKLINSCDASLRGDQLSSQIIPSSLLEQDTPRARLQLKRLKGSFFKPPRIVIVINLQHLLQSHEGQILLLTTNLNRVLFLLRHSYRMQQIDVVFNHLEKCQGFIEFLAHSDGIGEYSAEEPILEQLSAQQNSTKALLACQPANFMAFLAFAHSIPTISELMEKLLNDLLLTAKKAHARVYLRA
jgi:hypothetical protein